MEILRQKKFRTTFAIFDGKNVCRKKFWRKKFWLANFSKFSPKSSPVLLVPHLDSAYTTVLTLLSAEFFTISAEKNRRKKFGTIFKNFSGKKFGWQFVQNYFLPKFLGINVRHVEGI